MRKKIFLVLIIIAFTHSLNGCATSSIQVQSTVWDPGTEYEEKVIISYVWGIWNSPQVIIAPNCHPNPNNVNDLGLDEVTIEKNFGQCVVTFVTLGIINPHTIKWKCNKPPQQVEN